MRHCIEVKATTNPNPDYVPPSYFVGQNPPAKTPPPPSPGKQSVDISKMNLEVALVNQIIYQAIEHGGDVGGAYYSCDSSLRLAIQNWLDYNCYDKYYRVKKTRDCLITPIVSQQLEDFEF